MAKRILIFSLNYYPFVGGAEIAIKEITERISENDIEFHLIAYRFDANCPREEKIGNVTVHRVGVGVKGATVGGTFHPIAYIGKIFYVPFAASAALRLHRKKPFDIFWAMMSYMLFPIVLMRLVGIRKPYLLTIQEGDPFERVFERLRIRVVAPLLRYGFRNASAVQAISSFLLTWARTAGFTGKGEVIPNGVNTALFAKDFTTDDIASEKARFEKKDDDVFLVTTSRLIHKNAVDDVIRALVHLPANISFLIYGTGPDEDSLRTLVQDRGLWDRVRFMGQISHADMPLMLRACDIFIRPSRSEGMGNSFIEAMAAGIPVIATQEGGISDFLFDAKRNPEKEPTGWAVDANTPEQIVSVVEEILANPAQVERVTKTAKAMVIAEYDWNMVAERMKTLFDGLH
ncbi:MAG: 1,2-diacylglycerol 3-glucosyltransferase [Parcubacteria group bacterium]|nr:1,2-diacylglycerol 3-glucosyltransferase [Parcubacteria group bacterium]